MTVVDPAIMVLTEDLLTLRFDLLTDVADVDTDGSMPSLAIILAGLSTVRQHTLKLSTVVSLSVGKYRYYLFLSVSKLRHCSLLPVSLSLVASC